LGWVRGELAFKLACCAVFQTHPTGIRQLAQDRDDVRENQMPMFHRFISSAAKAAIMFAGGFLALDP
jgi:hypothetical protein